MNTRGAYNGEAVAATHTGSECQPGDGSRRADPSSPITPPTGRPRGACWKGIGIAFAVVLVAMLAWWLVGLSGDAAERVTDDPALEPLEPATTPAPIPPDRGPAILAA